MKIVFLDAATAGKDMDMGMFSKYGDTEIFDVTPDDKLCERLKDADVAITNKCKISAKVMESAEKLKLVCIIATGYDNVDIECAKKRGIAVCNVKGYSTDCVAQLTVSLVLSLVCHIREYDDFCKSGEYTKSGLMNCLEPVYYELCGKTWGLYGYGNIAKKVAEAAKALGCKVITCRKHKSEDVECVSLEELFERSDIVTLHTPLNAGTERSVNENLLDRIKKKNFILVNVARGGVTDEKAVAEAVKSGKIAGFAADVYTKEPMDENSPFYELLTCKNVIFTPHMAWGAYETRVRLLDETCKNIEAFFSGEKRNRIDLLQ
ncbi:MAG: hydroxyacid dehydrogenase [Clostridiales bacterium]|nr:hydroxyacid dehydrogenase [Clostridiales bacterium]